MPPRRTSPKIQIADGYRGIWYMNQPTKDEHRYKYSGGFATYPQQHVPIAIYVPSQQKTFFVFGGSAGNISERKDELQHLVSYYDHKTGTVTTATRTASRRYSICTPRQAAREKG